MRKRPNILVTGSVGAGKTSLCAMLAPMIGFEHIEVSARITEHKLYDEWDDKMNASIFNEDLVLDYLEPFVQKGGCLLDFHSCDFFS
mmetsp:Transcript_123720/g.283668  ORF Transcript_123720/g.283668 Transcript_123720/m.283668 type:complete len:87 (+) Transcript_123720:49-309(+)